MWQPLLLLAMAAAALHLVFLYLIRPVLIQKLRYNIFAQRDEIRLLALHKKIPATDRAYAILETRLNACVVAVESIDIADLLLIRPVKAVELETLQSMELINQSTPEVRAAYQTAMKCILGAVLLNSPIIAFLLPVILLAAILVGRFRVCVDVCQRKAWAVSGTPGLCPA